MKLTFKIAAAGVMHHPARAVLTLLSIVASCCVVVWVVAGYDAMVSQFDDMASKAMGRYAFIVVPDEPGLATLPPEAAALLNADPAVVKAEPVSNLRASIKKVNPDGSLAEPQMFPPPAAAPAPQQSASDQGKGQSSQARRGQGRPMRPMRLPFGPTLVGIDSAVPPYKLLKGEWLRPGAAGRMECVLSENAAKLLQAEAGDSVLVSIPNGGEAKLKVVGTIEQSPRLEGLGAKRETGLNGMPKGPMVFKGPASSALYAPRQLAEKISGAKLETSFLYVELNKKADPEEFEKLWSPKLAARTPKLFLASAGDVKEGLQEGMMVKRLKTQSYTATGLSLLAAFFIIFTTLSMGVAERSRQFAMLRAIGLSKARIASVILVEGLFLALLGWLGGLGAGWAMIKLMTMMKPQLFANGASLGAWCAIMTGACSLLGSFAAALIPAWKATKVSPLDAMGPAAGAKPFKLSGMATCLGILLLVVNPLVVFVLPLPDTTRYILYGAAGCTAMPIGFILLAPIAVIVAERLFSPLLALLLGLDKNLLSQQLELNIWRSMGTAISLTVGLGLFVSFQIWGYTMLGPFVPGDWVPDLLVAFAPSGIPASLAPEVARVDGVDSSKCLPMAVEQTKLANDIAHSQERSSVVNQDNVVLIGMEPGAAYGGASPLMSPKFVKGSQEEAVAKMKEKARRCVVPDHFSEQTGLGIGGKFSMIPPNNPSNPVEYEIAGIVSLQGWHWMTKFSGLRRNSGRSAAMVFASYDDVSRDFAIENPNFFWMRLRSGANLDSIDAAMQEIAMKGALGGAPAPTRRGFGVGSARPEARLTAASDVKERIGKRADGMIWAMCQLPLVILAICSLGVVNTVMASVRSRRWEMGILRAMGVTRSGLARLIVAEGLLVGLVACVLSLAFGVMAGWCGVGISQYASFFGGLHPTLTLPWDMLGLGFGFTLGLCLLAALWPSIATGRKEPLKLLQGGRGGSF